MTGMKDEAFAIALADAHWEWLESLLRKVYCDAFTHGFKHGQERDVGKK